MAGPMPGLLTLMEELSGRINKERLFGGGVRGAATRGLLGADAPPDATPAEMEAYRNFANASMALAAGPVAATRAVRGAKSAKTLAPQAQALETARQNAVRMLNLPESNTAMDRARAMGFVDAYHGTADDIRQLDPSKYGSATGAQSAKKAFFATSDPVTARTYAEYAATDAKVKKLLDQAQQAEKKGNWDKYDDLIRQAEQLESEFASQRLQGQTIMPLMIRANRGISGTEMSAGGQEFAALEGGINKFLNQAIRENKDLAVIKNLSDAVGRVDVPATHYAVLNPEIVRSRFAAFDPARVKDKDLLASLAAMGITLPLTMGLLSEQPD